MTDLFFIEDGAAMLLVAANNFYMAFLLLMYESPPGFVEAPTLERMEP